MFVSLEDPNEKCIFTLIKHIKASGVVRISRTENIENMLHHRITDVHHHTI